MKIIFGYKINLVSDNNNLVYSDTITKSQRVMRRQLILKEFGTNTYHIYGVENIVYDTLSRLPSAYINNSKPIIIRAHFKADELFPSSLAHNNNDFLPIYILL